MKKVIIIAGVVSLALSSCTSTKNVTYTDDLYANPRQERLEKERLAAEKKKKEEELAKKEAEERAAELAAQKAKDDANPLYKDPVYNTDDYYDYQYASRIRRFNQPVCGVGYYDNYYTNYYWYNGNPAMYGTSIYSSYNYWGPNYYSGNCWPSSYFGVSYGWGYPNYGYGNYNPYWGWGNGYSNAYWQGYYNGYNNGYANGYWGYPYGYNSPYYNGWNGWGYYNQFDVNSGYNKPTNAPRGSHDGGNSGRTSNPGLASNGLVQKYVQEVQVAQAMTPKFTTEARAVNNNPSKSLNSVNNYGSFENGNSNDIKPLGNSGNSSPRHQGSLNNPSNSDVNFNGLGNSGNTNNPKHNSGSLSNSGDVNFNNGNTNNPKNNTGGLSNAGDVQFGGSNPPKNQGGVNPISTEPTKPVKNYSNDDFNTPRNNTYESTKPVFNSGGNNNPSPSGNSPKSGGSIGGGRPR